MKPTTSKLKRALSLLLTLVLLGALSGTALAEEDIVSVTGTYCQTDARSMLQGLNAFRTSSREAWYWNEDNTTKTWCNDLKELTYDYTLEKIAMLRAAEITIKWAHERPNGTDCFTAYAGTDYRTKGENLAWGIPLDRDDALDALKETNEKYEGQGHRRNMLYEGFTAVGFAHFKYDGKDFWVQEFGSPALDTQKTPANDEETTVKVSLKPDSSGSQSSGSETLVSLTLRWPRNRKAQGYQLQYATNKKFTKKKTIKIKGNKTTKYTIKDQKGGRNYYVRVRGYWKSGKKTKYSKWINTVVFHT